MYRMFAFGLMIALLLVGSVPGQYRWGESGTAATVTVLLSTSTHETAPCNVGQGAVNSLLTMPEPGGARIKTQWEPEQALDFLPSELCAQHENVRTNRIAGSEDSARQRTATPTMPETIAIRYVSNGGNDTNDGLSWATAKHTIYGALVSLPGGSTNTAGSGTVYVGPNSSANPASGAGIWLMGSSDPNYASPPTGWLKCNGCELNIIGIANSAGGPNGHKPRVQLVAGGGTDRNHPAIWFSGPQQPIYIANFQIQYPGRAVIIGECSNNLRDGTCGVSGTILENVGAILQQTASNGPCTDIVSNVFWLWMRDYGCAGNAYTARGGITADNAAAILVDASTGQGSGLIYITDTNLAGGGIKVKNGANGLSLYVRNVFQEGDFVHPSPPTVWFTGWCAFCDAILDNIQAGDSGPGSMSLIETDNSNGLGGPTILNSAGATGPATMINPTANTFNISTISPTRQGQSGFFNNYIVGRTDVARRIAGLVPVRFPNKANVTSAGWSYTNTSGVQTLTTGLADPFGGTGAARIASSAATEENLTMGCPAYTPAAGDWIVVGIWGVGMTPGTQTIKADCYGYGFPTVSATYRNSGINAGDGQWMYQWQAYKVSGGSATKIGAHLLFSNTLTPTFYGPTLYIIPAGTLSDNEVLEFASTMNSIDTRCPVASICNVAAHPLVVSSYGTLSNCSSVASPAKCDSAPAGSFVLEVGSTMASVNTTAVTANSQILVIEDSSLGAKLHVSCNQTTGRTYMITDRAPGLSFAVSSSSAPTDHPACLSFQVLN
jgi:hypothetical protein